MNDLEELKISIIKMGYAENPDEAEEFHNNNFCGFFKNDVAFAQKWAENTNLITEDIWKYIDWELFARDLMHDYVEIDGNYYSLFG